MHRWVYSELIEKYSDWMKCVDVVTSNPLYPEMKYHEITNWVRKVVKLIAMHTHFSGTLGQICEMAKESKDLNRLIIILLYCLRFCFNWLLSLRMCVCIRSVDYKTLKYERCQFEKRVVTSGFGALNSSVEALASEESRVSPTEKPSSLSRSAKRRQGKWGSTDSFATALEKASINLLKRSTIASSDFSFFTACSLFSSSSVKSIATPVIEMEAEFYSLRKLRTQRMNWLYLPLDSKLIKCFCSLGGSWSRFGISESLYFNIKYKSDLNGWKRERNREKKAAKNYRKFIYLFKQLTPVFATSLRNDPNRRR